jgi:hypothetical protein
MFVQILVITEGRHLESSLVIPKNGGQSLVAWREKGKFVKFPSLINLVPRACDPREGT